MKSSNENISPNEQLFEKRRDFDLVWARMPGFPWWPGVIFYSWEMANFHGVFPPPGKDHELTVPQTQVYENEDGTTTSWRGCIIMFLDNFDLMTMYEKPDTVCSFTLNFERHSRMSVSKHRAKFKKALINAEILLHQANRPMPSIELEPPLIIRSKKPKYRQTEKTETVILDDDDGEIEDEETDLDEDYIEEEAKGKATASTHVKKETRRVTISKKGKKQLSPPPPAPPVPPSPLSPVSPPPRRSTKRLSKREQEDVNMAIALSNSEQDFAKNEEEEEEEKEEKMVPKRGRGRTKGITKQKTVKAPTRMETVVQAPVAKGKKITKAAATTATATTTTTTTKKPLVDSSKKKTTKATVKKKKKKKSSSSSSEPEEDDSDFVMDSIDDEEEEVDILEEEEEVLKVVEEKKSKRKPKPKKKAPEAIEELEVVEVEDTIEDQGIEVVSEEPDEQALARVASLKQDNRLIVMSPLSKIWTTQQQQQQQQQQQDATTTKHMYPQEYIWDTKFFMTEEQVSTLKSQAIEEKKRHKESCVDDANVIIDLTSQEKPKPSTTTNGQITTKENGSSSPVVVTGRVRRQARSVQQNNIRQNLLSGNLDPHTMVECEPYKSAKFPNAPFEVPFQVQVHPDAVFVADLHAHLATCEIIGYLGGRWDEKTKTIYIQAAFPCRSLMFEDDDGSTDVEMDPESDIEVRGIIEKAQLEVVGWYHSHPAFAPNPSIRDIENQSNYQHYMDRNQLAKSMGQVPFVGLIVGTFDTRRDSPVGLFRYFHIRPEKIGHREIGMPYELIPKRTFFRTVIQEEIATSFQQDTKKMSMYPDVFRALGWKNFAHLTKTIQVPVDTFAQRQKQKQIEKKKSEAKIEAKENKEKMKQQADGDAKMDEPAVEKDVEMINAEQKPSIINLAEEEACFIPMETDDDAPYHSQEDVIVAETPPEDTSKPEEMSAKPQTTTTPAAPIAADVSKLSLNDTVALPTPEPISVGGGNRRKSRKPSTTIKKIPSHMLVQVTSIASPGMDQCLGQVYQSTGPVFSDMSHPTGKISPIQDEIVGESQEENNDSSRVVKPAVERKDDLKPTIEKKANVEAKKHEVPTSSTTTSESVQSPVKAVAKVETSFQLTVSTYRCTLKYIEDLLEKRKAEERNQKPTTTNAPQQTREEPEKDESKQQEIETPATFDESVHGVVPAKSQKKARTKNALSLHASERETKYKMQQRYLYSLRHHYGPEVSACIEQVITLVDYYRDFGRRTEIKELWKPKINKLAKIKASLEENVQSLHLPSHLRKAFIKDVIGYLRLSFELTQP